MDCGTVSYEPNLAE